MSGVYNIGSDFWRFVSLTAEDARNDPEFTCLCKAVSNNDVFIIVHPFNETYVDINDVFHQLPMDLRTFGFTTLANSLDTFRANVDVLLITDDIAAMSFELKGHTFPP